MRMEGGAGPEEGVGWNFWAGDESWERSQRLSLCN